LYPALQRLETKGWEEAIRFGNQTVGAHSRRGGPRTGSGESGRVRRRDAVSRTQADRGILSGLPFAFAAARLAAGFDPAEAPRSE